MRKRRFTFLVAAGLLLALTTLLLLALHRQPSYKGKGVAELSRLATLYSGEGRMLGVTDEERRDALSGLRSLGPAGERGLIAQLRTRDTAWRRTYQNWWQRSPPFARRLLPPCPSAVYRRQIAVAAIGNLGPLSSPVEHALLLACRDTDPIVRAASARVLGYKGTRSPAVLEAIAAAMSDPKVAGLVRGNWSYRGIERVPHTMDELILGLSRPFQDARYQAASSLYGLGPKAAPAVPALIAACSDDADAVRVRSIKALGAIGAAASNAIPTLQTITQEENHFTSSAAVVAIEQIQAGRR